MHLECPAGLDCRATLSNYTELAPLPLGGRPPPGFQCLSLFSGFYLLRENVPGSRGVLLKSQHPRVPNHCTYRGCRVVSSKKLTFLVPLRLRIMQSQCL